MDETTYYEKMHNLRQYIPFLRRMILKLESLNDPHSSAQFEKIKQLLNILTDDKRRLKLNLLVKCERILKKIYDKTEGEWDKKRTNLDQIIMVPSCSSTEGSGQPHNSTASIVDVNWEGNYNQAEVVHSPPLSSYVENICSMSPNAADKLEQPRSPSPDYSSKNSCAMQNCRDTCSDSSVIINDQISADPHSMFSKNTFFGVRRSDPAIIPLERNDKMSEKSSDIEVNKNPIGSRRLDLIDKYDNRDDYGVQQNEVYHPELEWAKQACASKNGGAKPYLSLSLDEAISSSSSEERTSRLDNNIGESVLSSYSDDHNTLMHSKFSASGVNLLNIDEKEQNRNNDLGPQRASCEDSYLDHDTRQSCTDVNKRPSILSMEADGGVTHINSGRNSGITAMNIVVNPLPAHSKTSDVVQLFSGFPVIDVVMIPNTTSNSLRAYVRFSEPNDALRAFRCCREKKMFSKDFAMSFCYDRAFWRAKNSMSTTNSGASVNLPINRPRMIRAPNNPLPNNTSPHSHISQLCSRFPPRAFPPRFPLLDNTHEKPRFLLNHSSGRPAKGNSSRTFNSISQINTTTPPTVVRHQSSGHINTFPRSCPSVVMPPDGNCENEARLVDTVKRNASVHLCRVDMPNANDPRILAKLAYEKSKQQRRLVILDKLRSQKAEIENELKIYEASVSSEVKFKSSPSVLSAPLGNSKTPKLNNENPEFSLNVSGGVDSPAPTVISPSLGQSVLSENIENEYQEDDNSSTLRETATTDERFVIETGAGGSDPNIKSNAFSVLSEEETETKQMENNCNEISSTSNQSSDGFSSGLHRVPSVAPISDSTEGEHAKTLGIGDSSVSTSTKLESKSESCFMRSKKKCRHVTHKNEIKAKTLSNSFDSSLQNAPATLSSNQFGDDPNKRSRVPLPVTASFDVQLNIDQEPNHRPSMECSVVRSVSEEMNVFTFPRQSNGIYVGAEANSSSGTSHFTKNRELKKLVQNSDFSLFNSPIGNAATIVKNGRRLRRRLRENAVQKFHVPEESSANREAEVLSSDDCSRLPESALNMDALKDDIEESIEQAKYNDSIKSDIIPSDGAADISSSFTIQQDAGISESKSNTFNDDIESKSVSNTCLICNAPLYSEESHKCFDGESNFSLPNVEYIKNLPKTSIVSGLIYCNSNASNYLFKSAISYDDLVWIPFSMQFPSQLRCKYCDYKSRYRSHMLYHVFGHLKFNSLSVGASFKCIFCPETSNDIQLMRDHVSTHTGEHRYSCALCNWTTSLLSCLNEHLHDGQSVGLIRVLDVEDIRWDGVFAYVCSVCGFFRLNKQCVIHHAFSHHPSEIVEIYEFNAVSVLYDGRQVACPDTDITETALNSVKYVDIGDRFFHSRQITCHFESAEVNIFHSEVGVEQLLLSWSNSSLNRHAEIFDIPEKVLKVQESECDYMINRMKCALENCSSSNPIKSKSDYSIDSLINNSFHLQPSCVEYLKVMRDEYASLIPNILTAEDGAALEQSSVLTQPSSVRTTQDENADSDSDHSIQWEGYDEFPESWSDSNPCDDLESFSGISDDTSIHKDGHSSLVTRDLSIFGVGRNSEPNEFSSPPLNSEILVKNPMKSDVDYQLSPHINDRRNHEISGSSSASSVVGGLKITSVVSLKGDRALQNQVEFPVLHTVDNNLWSFPCGGELRPWKFFLTLKDRSRIIRQMYHVHHRSVFKCGAIHCSFTTNNGALFILHLKLHETCSLCTESINVSSRYTCKSTRNICVYCGFSVSKDFTDAELAEHIYVQHANSSLQCGFCFYRCTQSSYMKDHQRRYHPDLPSYFLQSDLSKPPTGVSECVRDVPTILESSLPPYVCTLNSSSGVCEAKFVRADKFYQHLRDIHTEKTCSLLCHICSLENQTFQQLLEHYVSHGVANYNCAYCGFSTQQQHIVKHHLVDFHPNAAPRCYSRMTKIFASEILGILEGAADTAVIPVVEIKQERHETSVGNDALENSCQQEAGVRPDICLSIQISPSKTVPVVTDGGGTLNVEEVCDGTVSCCDEDISVAANMGDNTERETGAVHLHKTLTVDPESIYRCGKASCGAKFSSRSELKKHIIECSPPTNGSAYNCYHCDRRIHGISSLLDHLLTHGPKIYRCSICMNTFTTLISTSRHLKQKHHIQSAITSAPMLPGRTLPLRDLFVVYPKCPHNEIFSVEQASELPRPAILSESITCEKCTYRTRVTRNMYKHLLKHANSASEETNGVIASSSGDTGTRNFSITPSLDPVNPRPCEFSQNVNKEQHEDRKSDDVILKKGLVDSDFISDEDRMKLPKEVAEDKKYVCSIEGCHYLTLNMTMLRHHIQAKHGQMVTYPCPHCENNSMIPDNLAGHLRLHGPLLFKCKYCIFSHYQRFVVLRHCRSRHNLEPVGIVVVRRPSADAIDKEDNSKEDIAIVKPDKRWSCCFCKFRAVSESVMLQHSSEFHQMPARYRCVLCNFTNSDSRTLQKHCESLHDNRKSKYLTAYHCFSQPITDPTISLSANAPLWRRNDLCKLRQIRGVMIESGQSPHRPSITRLSPKKRLAVFLERCNAPSSKKLCTNTNYLSREVSSAVSCKTNLDTNRNVTDSLSVVGTPHTPREVSESDNEKISADSTHYALSHNRMITSITAEKSQTDGSSKTFGSLGLADLDQCAFVCPLCSIFSTDDPSRLREHVYKEKGSIRYACSHCGYESSSMAHTKSHTVKHKKFRTPLKLLARTSDEFLEAWVTDVIKEQTLQLDRNQAIQPPEAVTNDNGDRRDIHLSLNSDDNDTMSTVSTPQLPSAERDVIISAVDMANPILMRVLCPRCGLAFGGRREMVEHLQVHYRRYKCGQCQFADSARINVVRHMAVQHPHEQRNVDYLKDVADEYEIAKASCLLVRTSAIKMHNDRSAVGIIAPERSNSVKMCTASKNSTAGRCRYVGNARNVALKSTSSPRRQAMSQCEFSYYGTSPPSPSQTAEVSSELTLSNGLTTRVNVLTLSQIFKLYPRVKLTDIMNSGSRT